MLDVLFTLNILLALVTIMVAINTKAPMDFSAFPTVILVCTMLRLGLNVASTRVVLLEGHKGGDAAGQVIEAFGAFVVGGNYVVGFIVFSILMIINFIVVTKGAGRSSEVAARFTLDAMPGRQMAIDADLAAGVIDQEEAKERRLLVSQESDFYGTMDGAAKYVRGDAIAGLLILLINLIGGVTIGLMQYDLTFDQAAKSLRTADNWRRPRSTNTSFDNFTGDRPDCCSRFYEPVSSRTGRYQLANRWLST